MEKNAKNEDILIVDSYKTALANYAELLDYADELGKQKLAPKERASILATISASAIESALANKSKVVDANSFHAAVSRYVNWDHLPHQPCVSAAPKILLRMEADPVALRTRSKNILAEAQIE